MANLLINQPPELKTALRSVTIIDDFERLDTNRWNTVEGDAGASIAVDPDGVNGLLDFATTSVNEEAYLYSNEILKFQLDKPFAVVARFQFAEANTDNFQFAFGIADGVAANFILDAGGIDATFDGAILYKKIGENKLRFLTSDGTTKVEKVLDITMGGSGFFTLGIAVAPNAAGTFDATPMVDTAGGSVLVQVAEDGASARSPLVKHSATFTTPTEMAYVIGMKQGSASAEAMKADLAMISAKR